MDDKEKPESSINTQYSYYNSNPYRIPQGFSVLGTNRIFNKPANIPIHMPIDYGVLKISDKENKTDK